MEGDTPDSSEHDKSERLDESESESQEEDIVAKVLSRRDVEGVLEYYVRYTDGQELWVDRSDIWDDGVNSTMITSYDKKYPIKWDLDCSMCGSMFADKNDGCEECRCDVCDKPCRHLKGINYGCVKHPVI